MTHVTCRLTAKYRDQLRDPTLGNRVWATFTFLHTAGLLRIDRIVLSTVRSSVVSPTSRGSLDVVLVAAFADNIDRTSAKVHSAIAAVDVISRHRMQVRYWILTSLYITQMISDKTPNATCRFV